jgi:hypothetical protein
MSPQSLTSLDVKAIALQAFVTALVAIMPSVFGRMMSGSRITPAQQMQDLCNRPPVFYNDNYDLTSLPLVNLVKNYFLYD